MPELAARNRVVPASLWIFLASMGLRCLAVAMLLVGIWVAITIPYHSWDALSYGEWSRLIAESWDFQAEGQGAATFHRPLFYVVQGVLWGVFDFHEWIGRLLAFSFTALFVVAVAKLAGRGTQSRLASALGAALLFLHPDVLRGLADGLTDVPLAALGAVTALTAWSPSTHRWWPMLLAGSAAATVLIKPPGLVVVACLLVTLVVWRMGRSAAEVVRDRVLPLILGTGLALGYDVFEAARLDVGLVDFLRAGSTGFYADQTRDLRVQKLLEIGFMGPLLRPLLVFSLLYGVARIARASHRTSVVTSVVLCPMVALGLPALAPQDTAPSVGSALTIVMLVTLTALFAWWAPEDAIPRRDMLGRLLILGVVPAMVWLWGAAYSTRLSSIAWPGLFALMAIAFAPALAGMAVRASILVLAPVAVVAVVGAYSYEQIDGLGPDRWRELRTLSLGEWFQEEKTGDIARRQLNDAVVLSEQNMDADDRLISASGEFRFFFPGRVTQAYPGSCDHLNGYRVFVLLTDDGTQQFMRLVAKVPGSTSYWASCRAPRLTQLTDGSGGFAVFRIES